MTKVGKLVTFRAGAELATKRCRKLNCTVPVGAIHSPEMLGGRSSSDCAASGTAAVSGAERRRKPRHRDTRALLAFWALVVSAHGRDDTILSECAFRRQCGGWSMRVLQIL